MYLWEALLSNVWASVLWIAIILIKKFSIQWFAVSIQCPKNNQKDRVVSIWHQFIWLFTKNGLKYTSTLKKWGFKKAKHKQNKLKAKPKSRWQTNFLWFWISFLAYLVMHLSKKKNKLICLCRLFEVSLFLSATVLLPTSSK